ncbi:MAG: hypothetical protein LBE14_06745 [Treponema sp.]|jgi:hypothetical protein|nr:hypothetical protein [Treponema sp.]
MGLLSKAGVKVSPELDEMGKVLRDRIRRLPATNTSPDTALSLLKAYGSFHTGICFFLSGEFYESYASSGAGTKKIKIPKNHITAPAGKKGFCRLDYPELFSGPAIPRGNLWVFSLDNESPRKRFLLITEDGNSPFHPELMAALLSEIRGSLIPPDRIAAPPPAKANHPAGQSREEIARGLRQYHTNHPSFQGILLEPPRKERGEAKNGFTERVSRMVSSFGSVFPLPPGNCLVLFPETIDRELLAHRLSKSLDSQVLRHFQADDPGTAIIQLGPYL